MRSRLVSMKFRRGLADFLVAVAMVGLCALIAILGAGCSRAPDPSIEPPAPKVATQEPSVAVPPPAAALPEAAPSPKADPPSGIARPATGSTADAQASRGAVPQAALGHRNDLIRSARAVWGLDAPVAVFAAQVHQESGWRTTAVSHVGAAGLAQFMPATSRWISGLVPELTANEPFNPGWALRALVTYDLYLYDRTPAAYGPRDRMWVALRGYNGGLGHWQAEARQAAGQGAYPPPRAAVDAACGRARRAKVHCAENLGYPHRILVVLQPRYLAWGPGL